MKQETFFERFDQFADAPGAVAKMRELVLGFSANGAPHTSLGQRPRKAAPHSFRALKGRANVPALGARRGLHPACWIAPSGLHPFFHTIPRALPHDHLVSMQHIVI